LDDYIFVMLTVLPLQIVSFKLTMNQFSLTDAACHLQLRHWPIPIKWMFWLGDDRLLLLQPKSLEVSFVIQHYCLFNNVQIGCLKRTAVKELKDKYTRTVMWVLNIKYIMPLIQWEVSSY